VKLLGVADRTGRKADILDVAWASRLMECGASLSEDELRVNYWADLSQSIARRPWSARMRKFGIRPHLYSFEKDRSLGGADCMKVHGWPASFLVGSPQDDLLQMAESGTSVPLATAIELVLWCNPWGKWHQ
jgi:hypothetical protein